MRGLEQQRREHSVLLFQVAIKSTSDDELLFRPSTGSWNRPQNVLSAKATRGPVVTLLASELAKAFCSSAI